MKPVDQTKLGVPDGNCFPACLASILERPLETIPEFKGEEWQARYADWLRELGLSLITIRLPDGIENSNAEARRYYLPGYCILAVQSPRLDGHLHAVVARDGEIVHDPHPMREMGVGKWMEADILTVLDPLSINR